MSTDAATNNGEASFLERTVGSIVNPIVDVVDLDRVLEDIDIDALLDRIDIDALLDRIDIDALLDRIDIDALLDRVDIDRLLDRIDIDRLMARVDVQALVARVDVNSLVQDVDVNALVQDVDVNAIVERTELGAIIARSTTGVFTELFDVVRTQIVTVDQVVQGLAGSSSARRSRVLPPAPPFDDADQPPTPDTSSERAIAVQGRAAGSVSRFLAFLVDIAIIGGLFALGAMLTEAAVRVIIGEDLTLDNTRLPITIAYTVWWFVYMSASLAATGRTIGKALLGVMVVEVDGSTLHGRRAMLRTLVFPISFLVFGVGFLIGLFRRDRRELHDLIAGTTVIYAWDATTAQVRASALAEVETPTAA